MLSLCFSCGYGKLISEQDSFTQIASSDDSYMARSPSFRLFQYDGHNQIYIQCLVNLCSAFDDGRCYQVNGSSSLHDRATVRRGAEIGLLSLGLRAFQGASLGDFLLAPVCPIENITLWVGFLCLTSGSKTDEGVAKAKFLPELGLRPKAQ